MFLLKETYHIHLSSTHIIGTYPNDNLARPVKTTVGTVWKCRNCQIKEHEDLVLKEAPDSPLARDIKKKRLQELEAQRKRVASLMKFHKLSGEKI